MIAVERFMGRTMAAGRSFIYTGNTGIQWTNARTSSPAGSRIGRAPVSAGANITGANRVLAFHRMACKNTPVLLVS